MKILVFDTETSGLPPKGPEELKDSVFKDQLLSFDEGLWSDYLHLWPELLQLTYFIYNDDETGEVDEIYDEYLDISPETKEKMENNILNLRSKEIDTSAAARAAAAAGVLQGNLDRLEMANKKNICDVVCKFLNDVKRCDVVVGHNINFDILMMIASSKKALVDEDCKNKVCKDLNTLIQLLNIDSLNKVCTMIDGKEVCNQVITKMIDLTNKKTGKKFKKKITFIKTPKLIELFNKLFDKDIDESKLHDSKYDVLITLLVYLKLKNPTFQIPDVSDESKIETSNPVMKEYYDLIKAIMVSEKVSASDKAGGKKTKKKTSRKLKKTKKTKMKKKAKTSKKKKSNKSKKSKKSKKIKLAIL